MSEEEGDMAARHFINWYIQEQVEEEASVDDIIKKMKMFGQDKSILYHIDIELGKREYTQHKYS